MNEWKQKYSTSRRRLRDLLIMDVPDIILRNECYLLLAAEAGGPWRAMARWAASRVRDRVLYLLSFLSQWHRGQ